MGTHVGPISVTGSPLLPGCPKGQLLHQPHVSLRTSKSTRAPKVPREAILVVQPRPPAGRSCLVAPSTSGASSHNRVPAATARWCLSHQLRSPELVLGVPPGTLVRVLGWEPGPGQFFPQPVAPWRGRVGTQGASGPGMRPLCAAVGRAKPSRIQEQAPPPSPSPPHIRDRGLHLSEPVSSLQNGISNPTFTRPMRAKWHSPAWGLPGGGSLLGRGWKENSALIPLGRKQNVLPSCLPPVSCATL